jgi:hypothetical protein
MKTAPVTLVLLLGACSSSTAPGTASTGQAGGSGVSEGGAPDSAVGTGAGDAAEGSAGGDTWSNYAQGFFAMYCVECHAAGNATRDYSTLTDVVRDQVLIRCGVAASQDPTWNCPASLPAKQFPISNATGSNPKPTDAERTRIVAWINAGLPQ